MKRREREGGRECEKSLPLFRTACHSSLLFSTGKEDMLCLAELEVENRDPMNGNVGIEEETRTVPLENGESDFGEWRELVVLART